MPISFSQIPANIKVPLYWVEVDPSKAGLPQLMQPALLVGTMLAPGDATPNVPVAIGSQAQADARFGQGSELSRMFKAYYANNFANEVYGLPLEEPTGLGPPAPAAASGTITLTVAAEHDPGTLHLYIGGEHVPVGVSTADTADTLAAEVAAQINADLSLPVSAAAAAGVVTLTCNWVGVTGNDIRVDLNYYGSIGGQETPNGVTVALPGTVDTPTYGFLSGGAAEPDMDEAIANLGEKQFEYVAMPYTDAQSLYDWDQEYGFTDQGRWGWQRQLFGHIFSAKRGEYADLVTFGDEATPNSGVISILAVETKSPTPTYEWTAAYAAKAQRALINDPARPLQTLSLNQVKLAPVNDRFTFVDLNSMAQHGLAIQKPGSDNQPMIAREQTTYRLNLYGQSDDAYELVTTLATLARLLRNQRQAITSKFPRHKLANDGTRFGPGQAIVTPGIIKAELIAQYRQDQFSGLVEDTRAFKQHLLVERDPNDPNRVNVLYPPDLVNQLRVFAVLAQFRLQYDRGVDQEITGLGNVGVTGVAAA